MSFALLEIQKGIYAKLHDDATLGAMVSGVFDRVPEQTEYPYLVIGQAEMRDWSSATTVGQETLATVEVFSRKGGRKEALQILARIHALLHEGSFTVSGHALVQCRMERADVNLLSDGHTTQARMVMRILTQENA